jgi:hypothetical protein
MTEIARRAARASIVALVAAIVAGCIPGLPWGADNATPTPSPTASPTPLSTVDAFRAHVLAIDFQAEGPVSGDVKAKTIIGERSGSVSGTFKVKGGDSSYSITAKLLGINESADYVVIGDQAWSRANGGAWVQSKASGRSMPVLVAGLILVDAGVETKFGRSLHHLTVSNPSDVDLSAFGIPPGSRDNLTVTLSFWAEADGTPAGLTVAASFDQKVLGTSTHETVTMDVQIQSLSGVSINAPTS